MLEDDMGGSQRRMAAQIDLDLRREPAQPPECALGHQEGRLGEIVFERDRLQKRIRRPFLQQADGGRVSGERPVRKGVHLVERYSHGAATIAAASRKSSRSGPCEVHPDKPERPEIGDRQRVRARNRQHACAGPRGHELARRHPEAEAGEMVGEPAHRLDRVAHHRAAGAAPRLHAVERSGSPPGSRNRCRASPRIRARRCSARCRHGLRWCRAGRAAGRRPAGAPGARFRRSANRLRPRPPPGCKAAPAPAGRPKAGSRIRSRRSDPADRRACIRSPPPHRPCPRKCGRRTARRGPSPAARRPQSRRSSSRRSCGPPSRAAPARRPSPHPRYEARRPPE